MGTSPPSTPPRDRSRGTLTTFVSYAHGDDAWNATILDFAIALRTVGGIDADLDAWHASSGQDWDSYGPTAIEENDVILIAVSATYKDAWQRTNPSHKNAGVAREAAVLKSIFNEDQDEFQRRVRLVVLPGASKTNCPRDLSMIERIEVTAFDLDGLEPLLRSILNKPKHVKPALAPLPALPPDSVARMKAVVPQDEDASAPPLASRVAVELQGEQADDLPEPRSRAADDDLAQAEDVASLLERIDLRIASIGDEVERDRLLVERSAVKASLEAVDRALALGAARQRMVGNYLDAQLYFSAGAYRAAERRLLAVADRLADESSDPMSADLEPCLRELTAAMLALNEGMRTLRYAPDTDTRHPPPPELRLRGYRFKGVHEFYEVARGALRDESAEPWEGVIRTAILRGRADEHAAGLYARFTEQQAIARAPLELGKPSDEGGAKSAEVLANSGLDAASDSRAATVLAALAEAHLEIHRVEHRRSATVGEILARDKAAIDTDKKHLRRSIVLNTFALQITETLPWIFAADASDREAIQGHEEVARRELDPVRPLWRARQVTLLALYRRSHGFRLLGDHERAYDDLRKLQRLGRLSRLAHPDDRGITGWVDTLEALAEYRIGELYRADHDYMQALVHLCRSHDSVEGLGRRTGSTIAKELEHLEIKLSLGKGKAFFEIGAMKRSLKWHITAWRWLLDLDSPEEHDLAAELESLEQALDDVKHDPVLHKPAVLQAIGPVLQRMCQHDLSPFHRALEADILIRISHLLTAVRLEDDRSDSPNGASSALTCMLRAAELDACNLLVQTGLLRYEMRRATTIPSHAVRDPLACWPSGASDVDQMIRVAEHLMLERLHAAGGRTTGRTGVARALMGHFMTHTDSINLRGAILHRYLMRRRAEDREPWYDDADSGQLRRRAFAPLGETTPYLEFVCLRRFGSFTPFMPRPAAVSAVGGGYLVRVVRPAPDEGDGRPSIFNIIVDPGEGAVNNLYAMGLSIADIDMVIATHDHPEHLAALDAVLSLRGEFHKRERVKPADPTGPSNPADGRPRLLILGNRSVVNRYSFLNGDGHHLVQHIADAAQLGGGQVPDDVTIEQLPTKHEDLGGSHASGFVLNLASKAPEGDEACLRIAFTADTSIKALYEDGDPKRLRSAWSTALASDIVVAHVSDVPIGELRHLADLPPAKDSDAVDAFDEGVSNLFRERSADASQLMHALSLVSADPTAEPVSLLDGSFADSAEQLYLSGLLDVCDHMCDAPEPPDAGARILVVGELKEQLGSFRGTIAREINGQLSEEARKNGGRPRVIALTADIGLRIRLTAATSDDGHVAGTGRVLCSTCSYNNDRLDIERFHAPQNVREVCVKGDHEAMYWNCDLHDPGTRNRPKFIEQMGGYNPFAAGGRYHG